MILLGAAWHQAQAVASLAFRLVAKRGVHGRQPVVLCNLNRPLNDRLAPQRLKTGPCQKPTTSDWREWHGDLQLGVIPPPSAFISMRPIVIENIFALTVRFQEKRCKRNGLPVQFGANVIGVPPCADTNRTAIFQRLEKAVSCKRVFGAATVQSLGTGASIPLLRINLRQAVVNTDLNVLIFHSKTSLP